MSGRMSVTATPRTKSSHARAPGIEELLGTFSVGSRGTSIAGDRARTQQKQHAAAKSLAAPGTPEARKRNPLALRPVNVVAQVQHQVGHAAASPQKNKTPEAPINTRSVLALPRVEEQRAAAPAKADITEKPPSAASGDSSCKSTTAVSSSNNGSGKDRQAEKHAQYLSRLHKLAPALRSSSGAPTSAPPQHAPPPQPQQQHTVAPNHPQQQQQKKQSIGGDWQLFAIIESTSSPESSTPSPVQAYTYTPQVSATNSHSHSHSHSHSPASPSQGMTWQHSIPVSARSVESASGDGGGDVQCASASERVKQPMDLSADDVWERESPLRGDVWERESHLRGGGPASFQPVPSPSPSFPSPSVSPPGNGGSDWLGGATLWLAHHSSSKPTSTAVKTSAVTDLSTTVSPTSHDTSTASSTSSNTSSRRNSPESNTSSVASSPEIGCGQENQRGRGGHGHAGGIYDTVDSLLAINAAAEAAATVAMETPTSFMVQGLQALRAGLFPASPAGAGSTNTSTEEEPQVTPPVLALVTASFVGGEGCDGDNQISWAVESHTPILKPVNTAIISSRAEEVKLLREVAAVRGAEMVDRECEIQHLKKTMDEKRRSMDVEIESMRKEVEERRRKSEAEVAALLERASDAEQHAAYLAHQLQQQQQQHQGGTETAGGSGEGGGGVGGGGVEMEELRERAATAEYEKTLLEKQLAQLQQSMVETSQTFAMLKVRNKEQLMQSVERRIGYRLLARIIQSWSLFAREARRGGAYDDGGEGLGHEAEGGDQDRLSVMEDWVKELTAQLEHLEAQNSLLRAQSQSQSAQTPEARVVCVYTTHTPSTEMKQVRPMFLSWRCWTSTARAERRGTLADAMEIWRERCAALCARQPTLREMELQQLNDDLQQQLLDAQSAVSSEQETSEKFVFLLTEKENALEMLSKDLAKANHALDRKAEAEAEHLHLRQTLAEAQTKVSLLEDHAEELARKEACGRRQLDEKDKDLDRFKCRVEELQAQVQHARVREKIWVLETTGNLSESSSGRRCSGGGADSQLRGARLICLEKAYTFTQYLMRARAKRLLLRVLYSWGSEAAGRQMHEAYLRAAAVEEVKRVEQATNTEDVGESNEVVTLRERLETLEQDAMVTADAVRSALAQRLQPPPASPHSKHLVEEAEREVLATSLAICRERVQALEAKVEQLQTVEAAYRSATFHVAASASNEIMQSPVACGADSTMATVSNCSTSMCSQSLCFERSPGANTELHAISPLRLNSSTSSTCSRSKTPSSSNTRARPACSPPTFSTSPPTTAASGAIAPETSPLSAGQQTETTTPSQTTTQASALPGMSPLISATSDWLEAQQMVIVAKSPNAIEAQPVCAKDTTHASDDDDVQGVLLREDLQADKQDVEQHQPHQELEAHEHEVPPHDVHHHEEEEHGPLLTESGMMSMIRQAARGASGTENGVGGGVGGDVCRGGESGDGSLMTRACSPLAGALAQGKECTPSATHRGHRQVVDASLDFLDHSAAAGAEHDAHQQQHTRRQQQDVMPQKARGQSGVGQQKEVEIFLSQPCTDFDRNDTRALKFENFSQCLTPRTVLLNELRSLSVSLSMGAFPAAPQQQQQQNQNKNKKKKGVKTCTTEETDNEQDVLENIEHVEHWHQVAQGEEDGGEREEEEEGGADKVREVGRTLLAPSTPNKNKKSIPMSPRKVGADVAAEAKAGQASTALARISAMPNPFTGSPGFGLRARLKSQLADARMRAAHGEIDNGPSTCSSSPPEPCSSPPKIRDMKGLLDQSLSMFASPHKNKSHATRSAASCLSVTGSRSGPRDYSSPTSTPAADQEHVVACDPLSVESRFFNVDSGLVTKTCGKTAGVSPTTQLHTSAGNSLTASNDRAWTTCNVWDEAQPTFLTHKHAPTSPHRQRDRAKESEAATKATSAPALAGGRQEEEESAQARRVTKEAEEALRQSIQLSPISGSRFQSPAVTPRVAAQHRTTHDPVKTHKLAGATGSGGGGGNGQEGWGDAVSGAACDGAKTCKSSSSHASMLAPGGAGSQLSTCQQWLPAAASDHLQLLQQQQQQYIAQTLDADLHSYDASSPTTSDMAASHLLAMYKEPTAKTGWVMSPRGSITWMGPGEPPRGLPQRASTVGTPIDTAINKRIDMGEHKTHSSKLSSTSQLSSTSKSLFRDSSVEGDSVHKRGLMPLKARLDSHAAEVVVPDCFVEVGADDSQVGDLSVMQLESDSVDIDPGSVMFF